MSSLQKWAVLFTGATFSAGSAYAVPVAIVDSGTDLGHPALRDVAWTNVRDEDDAVDNDDNGYIDDTHGWNFAENDNRLFEKKFVGTFSKDVFRFFEIQTKSLQGTATDAEKQWVQDQLKNADFIAQLNLFGNFVHGSHVAGIASANAPGAEIMPLKLIPTKAPKPFASLEANGMAEAARSARGEELKKKLVLVAIDYLGKAQSQVFSPIAGYLHTQKARVANCSFGTGHHQAEMILGPLLKAIFKREIPAAELAEYATYFVNAVLKNATTAFVQPAPDTLFVMAAGNDGSDNDVYPSSPANIKSDHTITVAATNGFAKLASFSNYGKTMVDIAAPGVGIRSTIPGGEFVELSGTSQAAPFVANIAGQILDVNPTLTPADVKRILMGTADVKEFLRGKVAASGIANAERSLVAAQHTRSVSLEIAISRAMAEVKDQVADVASSAESEAFFVLPLPSLTY